MSFRVRTERHAVTGGLDGTVYVLESDAGDRADIWPALGCNCFRWQAAALDLLYAPPELFQDPRPTRVGVPVLFPFPNRIRDGRFTWQGKEYRLPLNDPAKKNAIHGFACRRPWRVVDHGAQADNAWLTAEFWGSKDAPETLDLWPADYRLRLTVRLGQRWLRLEAVADNPAAVPLPFGLGYHPYFRVPLTPAGDAAQCLVEVDADQFWELRECLPTGRRLPVDAAHDLTTPRPYPQLQLDDLLEARTPSARRGSPSSARRGSPSSARRGSPDPAETADRRSPNSTLHHLGSLRQLPEGIELHITAASDFRTAVVFTPPHRQAFCLEPYTCVTDAINLQQQGLDAGLRVLAPGEQWSGVMEIQLHGPG